MHICIQVCIYWYISRCIMLLSDKFTWLAGKQPCLLAATNLNVCVPGMCVCLCDCVCECKCVSECVMRLSKECFKQTFSIWMHICMILR